ncbi:hypothetical protein L3X38_009505 [Prunus dulcis]|uniref:Uncharacterized protein n=1 Tax=Prunus dulcis TaxID=3755 RepID=A0AAD4WDN4_PRUDU|nr:hypothetical protein L3X38_009505 [Prunus dulcis]
MQQKMANSKDDIKYGTSQERLNEDEAVRVAYKHGTPLEGGKIADSEPVDLFPVLIIFQRLKLRVIIIFMMKILITTSPR